jgi:hypothetical protein
MNSSLILTLHWQKRHVRLIHTKTGWHLFQYKTVAHFTFLISPRSVDINDKNALDIQVDLRFLQKTKNVNIQNELQDPQPTFDFFFFSINKHTVLIIFLSDKNYNCFKAKHTMKKKKTLK